jgi:dipeptidyl aminopeptidase/acylaminoacyl peptidase
MFDLLILTRKRMAREGKSPEEVEKAVRRLEEQFQGILGDPLNTDKFFMGHAYRRWSGFLKDSPMEALLKSRAKLFLAHGTEDESVPIESFDLLVLELLRVGRDDAVVRRYPGRGHGLSASDRPANSPPMTDVFEEIISWSLGRAGE